MPQRTKPDPYRPDEIKAAMRAAVRASRFADERDDDKGERAVCKAAEVDPRNLKKYLNPAGKSMDLVTVVRLAAELELTVSQFIGETPLVPAPSPSGEESQKMRALRDLLAATQKMLEIAQEENEQLRRGSLS